MLTKKRIAGMLQVMPIITITLLPVLQARYLAAILTEQNLSTVISWAATLSNLFLFLVDASAELGRAFVPGEPFQPSVVVRPGAYSKGEH